MKSIYRKIKNKWRRRKEIKLKANLNETKRWMKFIYRGE